MRYEIRNVLRPAQYQYDEQLHFFGQRLEQIAQECPGLNVQSDERVVQNEGAGNGKQGACQLELAQLAAAE